jgi:hypothetical protein
MGLISLGFWCLRKIGYFDWDLTLAIFWLASAIEAGLGPTLA